MTAGLDRVLAAIASGVQVYDLARPLVAGMPGWPLHPPYQHALIRRHGDHVREGGQSSANDLIVTGTHVGTHVDALAHASYDGLLHGGRDAGAAQLSGRFSELGVETIEPIVGRGVLLDVAGALGVDSCDADYEVTPADLRAAEEMQGTPVQAGDAVLVRTGWGRWWDDADRYVGLATGLPGPGEAGARWLAERRARVVGSDTLAFERLALDAEGKVAGIPAHRVLLVEHGIPIIENLSLEQPAARRVHEFVFVLAPLALVGATGSPVRPLAVVSTP